MTVKSNFDDTNDDDGDGGGNDNGDDDGDDDNCGGDYDGDDTMLLLLIMIMIQVVQNWKRIVYTDNPPTNTLTHVYLPHSQQQPVIISPQGTSSLLRQGNTAVPNAIPANK